MSERWADTLALGLGVGQIALDRFALALALAEREGALPPSVPSSAGDPDPSNSLVSDPPGAEGLFQTLSGDDDASVLLARGRALLRAAYQMCGNDALRLVDTLVTDLADPTAAGPVTSARGVVVGVSAAGTELRWRVNEEGGAQTAPHVGIAGQSGMGKSQLLMHLLGAMGRPGLIFLDYKGDISVNEEFLRATGATVIQPGRAPVPINPFHIPEGTPVQLVPRVLAEVFAEGVGGTLGDVQRHRLERAMGRVYDKEGNEPSLSTVRATVQEIYEEDGAGPDQVLSLLARLTTGHLFADRPSQNTEQFLAGRWIIDLHDLQGIEVFVALVLLNHLHQVVRTLDDAAISQAADGTRLRALRTIIAIDEAHYYLKGRCEPLLQLVRIGRSKGVAVFLSSQSLSDFHRHDVLREQLPTLFLFRHGAAPTRDSLRGALGLSSDAQARAIRESITALEQFQAFTTVGGDDPASPVRVRAFFETQRNG